MMSETPLLAASASCDSPVSVTNLSGQITHLAIVNINERSKVPQQISGETLALIRQATSKIDEAHPGPSKRVRIKGPSDAPQPVILLKPCHCNLNRNKFTQKKIGNSNQTHCP